MSETLLDRRVIELTDLERWVSSVIAIGENEDWYEGGLDIIEMAHFEGSSLRIALDELSNGNVANFDKDDKRTWVGTSKVAVGFGETKECSYFGTYHIVAEGGVSVVMWIEYTRTEINIYVASNSADRGAREAATSRLVDLATGRCSAWRGKTVQFDPTGIDQFRHLAPVGGGGIDLDDGLEDELRLNLVVPICNYQQVKASVSSRGVLLFGRPGTGKTWATRWVQENVAGFATVIVATPEMFSNAGLMLGLFAFAGAFTPTLLIMEDLDVTIRSRFDTAGAGALGELLSHLDGPGRVAGVFTIATTNHIAALDAALSERPGRFDRKIEISDATIEARRSILNRIADELDIAEATRPSTIDSVLSRTEGWTLAEFTELSQLALLHSLDQKKPIDLISAIGSVHRPVSDPTQPATGYV